jgi:hypothetical protein
MDECLQQWNDTFILRLLRKFEFTAVQNGLIRATGGHTTNYVRRTQYENLKSVIVFHARGTNVCF